MISSQNPYLNYIYTRSCQIKEHDLGTSLGQLFSPLQLVCIVLNSCVTSCTWCTQTNSPLGKKTPPSFTQQGPCFSSRARGGWARPRNGQEGRGKKRRLTGGRGTKSKCRLCPRPAQGWSVHTFLDRQCRSCPLPTPIPILTWL